MTTATLEAMRAAFLQDICAHPERDDVRLIYADWLTENGEEDRGEFIRIQIELAKRIRCVMCSNKGHMRYEFGTATCQHCYGRNAALSERERVLFADSGPVWWNDLPGNYRATDSHGTGITTANGWEYEVRRGFVAEVRCPWPAWEKHGPDLVTRHPVERVTLTGRKPQLELDYQKVDFAWYSNAMSDDYPAFIGDDLWALLPLIVANGGRQKTYKTEAAAMEDFSAAAIAWARAEAARRKGEGER